MTQIAKQVTKLFAVTALAVAMTVPAVAETSIAGGAFAPATSGTAAGGVLSTNFAIPGAPLGIRPQLSVAAPLSGGDRYALTGEVRSGGPEWLGIGAGVGKLDRNGTAGAVLDALAGTRIAPHTALVARFYQGLHAGVGTSGFFGLQFST